MAAILFPIPQAHAESDQRTIYAQVGVYRHYRDDDDYQGANLMVAAELKRGERDFIGLALFDNSFGQFAQFAYLGRTFPLTPISRDLRVKLAAGIVHGYSDEHEDVLPYNWGSWAPAIVPSIGFQRSQLGIDLVLLSDSAWMVTVGREFEI